jgi:protease IV
MENYGTDEQPVTNENPVTPEYPAIPGYAATEETPVSPPELGIAENPVTHETPVGPPPARPRFSPGMKWLMVIIVSIIILAGLGIAAYYLAHSDSQGVKVVRMEGVMMTGDFEDSEGIGSELVGRELREAADDPMVEAIVLRVNSPGGTPSAAQEIIGDLEYAKTKKPVFVSMGDMGTSAAYYVSAHADRIYANPDTFTSGVGVIWRFSDISRYNEKEGYNFSVVKSGSKKDMGTTARPLSTDEQAYAEKIVDDSFENFIADVTSQRSINRADIEDGRVIRGADAVKLNIIDQLGNLNDAIDGAKKMAESRR